jgi:hypothetical protein
MRTRTTTRFWIEAALAVLSAFLSLVTLVARNWIELIFRVDADHGSGTLEWVLVGALIFATGVTSSLARAERRRSDHLRPGARALKTRPSACDTRSGS